MELSEARVLGHGLEYDRMFCLAEEHEIRNADGEKSLGWEIIPQRTHPQMNHVKVEIWRPDPSSSTYKEDGEYVKSNGCMVVSFPIKRPVKYSFGGINSAFGKFLSTLSRASTGFIPHNTFRVHLQPSVDQIESLKL